MEQDTTSKPKSREALRGWMGWLAVGKKKLIYGMGVCCAVWLIQAVKRVGCLFMPLR